MFDSIESLFIVNETDLNRLATTKSMIMKKRLGERMHGCFNDEHLGVTNARLHIAACW